MKTNTLNPSDRWSLDSWFSGFAEKDYADFKAQLVADTEALRAKASSLTTDTATLVLFINELEKIGDSFAHLSAYLGCLSADDANNEAVKIDEAWIAGQEAELSKVHTALQGLLVTLDEDAFAQLLNETSLKDAQHAIRRMREKGFHQMDPPLEALAADLNVNGLHAWGRLYDTLTGKMAFTMTFPDGHSEVVPMSRRRALMSEPDRGVRLAAFHGGQQPWHEHAVTLAAALNGIAGTRLTLYGRRGLNHFLEAPLFDSALSAASLEAMMEAINANIELPRRALRHAAVLQGTPALHYCDLEAPQLPMPEEKPLTWGEACATVDHAFSAVYPKLGAYLREMLKLQWIEAQPRPAKKPGAFCTGTHLRQEERVYMTFYGTVHDMVTLAHEAGHAWHTRILRPARSLAAHYPMTLAETASNFGEMILLNGLMADPSITAATKAYLLDQEMLRAHAYLVNILMRYEFEKAFYTERAGGEVAVSRLSELMDQAQRKLYGDTLLSDGTDPMFWASKLHFFITELSFYNFPYVFGYLLSQALFARFKAEGPSFLPRYEAFLAMTGKASCEEVVKNTLGEDLTDPSFWTASVKALEPSILAYEALCK